MNPDIESLPLRDIHLPDPVSWWPLAPGWWIVLGLLALFIVLYFIVRHTRKKRRLVNDALRQFNALVQRYQLEADSQVFLNELSVLLRRLSISAYPAKEVAGLTGESWLGFLDATRRARSGTVNFNSSIGQLLLSAPYQRNVTVSGHDIEKLIAVTRAWIRDLRVSNPDSVNDQSLVAGGH